MTIWVDAQLSPALAPWLSATIEGMDAYSVRKLGLRDADDDEIFFAAREANAIVVTKDADFIRLLNEHGPPPKIIWLTCGNTSNAALRVLLETALPEALALIEGEEAIVEIR